MGFFYDIEKKNDITIIRFTKYPFFLIFTFGGSLSALYYFATGRGIFLIIPFGAGMFLFSLPYLELSSKIKRRMKEGGVKVYGSKWSFSNPITFELDNFDSGLKTNIQYYNQDNSNIKSQKTITVSLIGWFFIFMGILNLPLILFFIPTGIGIIKRKEFARKFGVGIQIFQAAIGLLIIIFGALLSIPELFLLGLAETGLATFIIIILMRENVVMQFSDS